MVEDIARIFAAGSVSVPRVRIWLRADSGFARDDLMAWCEANGVDFLFALARNERLVCEIVIELHLVAAKSRCNGRSERRFKSFMWTTRESWSCRRRVVAKAEWTQGEANPRFVVTSLRRDECKASGAVGGGRAGGLGGARGGRGGGGGGGGGDLRECSVATGCAVPRGVPERPFPVMRLRRHWSGCAGGEVVAPISASSIHGTTSAPSAAAREEVVEGGWDVGVVVRVGDDRGAGGTVGGGGGRARLAVQGRRQGDRAWRGGDRGREGGGVMGGGERGVGTGRSRAKAGGHGVGGHRWVLWEIGGGGERGGGGTARGEGGEGRRGGGGVRVEDVRGGRGEGEGRRQAEEVRRMRRGGGGEGGGGREKERGGGEGGRRQRREGGGGEGGGKRRGGEEGGGGGGGEKKASLREALLRPR